MKIIKVRDIDRFASLVIPKPTPKNKKTIESIISDVKKNGDLAVKKYEKKFGGQSSGSLRVSSAEIKSSYSKVKKDEIQAIKFKQVVGGVTHVLMNSENCNGCGECVSICPANAITIQ